VQHGADGLRLGAPAGDEAPEQLEASQTAAPTLPASAPRTVRVRSKAMSAL
jgi:hypothetical protein